MFYNSFMVRAVVPATIARKRSHQGQVLKEDEVEVCWPCHFDRNRKIIRGINSENIQLDAILEIHATAEVAMYMQSGTLLRFEHERNHYYRIYDIDEHHGLFNNNNVMSARLVRQEMTIQSTQKRTLLDEDEVYVLTDISDDDPPPPDKERRKWGY